MEVHHPVLLNVTILVLVIASYGVLSAANGDKATSHDTLYSASHLLYSVNAYTSEKVHVAYIWLWLNILATSVCSATACQMLDLLAGNHVCLFAGALPRSLMQLSPQIPVYPKAKLH